MGGDYAPEAAVKGAVMALDAIGPDSRIVLFGDEAKVKAVLAAEGCPAERFDIVATTQVIIPPRRSRPRPTPALRWVSGTLPKGP